MRFVAILIVVVVVADVKDDCREERQENRHIRVLPFQQGRYSPSWHLGPPTGHIVGSMRQHAGAQMWATRASHYSLFASGEKVHIIPQPDELLGPRKP